MSAISSSTSTSSASPFPVISIPRDHQGNPLEKNLFIYLPDHILLNLIRLLPTEDKKSLALVNHVFLKRVLFAIQSPLTGLVDLYTTKKVSFEFFLQELRNTQRRMPPFPISSPPVVPREPTSVNPRSLVETEDRLLAPEALREKTSLLLHLLASTNVIDRWMARMKQKLAQPFEDVLRADLKARSITLEDETIDQFKHLNTLLINSEENQIITKVMEFSDDELEKYNQLLKKMDQLDLGKEKKLKFMMNSELPEGLKECYRAGLKFDSRLQKFIKQTLCIIPLETRNKFSLLLGKILGERLLILSLEKIIGKLREKGHLHPIVYSSYAYFPLMLGYSFRAIYDIPSLLKCLCILFDGASSDFETLLSYFLSDQLFLSNSPCKNNQINPMMNESVNMLKIILPFISAREDFTAEQEAKESDETDFMKKLDALQKQIIRKHLITCISQGHALTDEELIKILHLLRLNFESKQINEPGIDFSCMTYLSLFDSLVDILELSKENIDLLRHEITHVKGLEKTRLPPPAEMG